mmetsp:Transcript_10411/g.27775  ORF Transcript_10411/g.27775 Transcript_10411/m.27775 type:complete len:205 (+) Transcript_10411:749-1363(+)
MLLVDVPPGLRAPAGQGDGGLGAPHAAGVLCRLDALPAAESYPLAWSDRRLVRAGSVPVLAGRVREDVHVLLHRPGARDADVVVLQRGPADRAGQSRPGAGGEREVPAPGLPPAAPSHHALLWKGGCAHVPGAAVQEENRLQQVEGCGFIGGQRIAWRTIAAMQRHVHLEQRQGVPRRVLHLEVHQRAPRHQHEHPRLRGLAGQ